MEANGTINVSVSNLYREASYNSEIVTQAILGEGVKILDQGPVFTKILQQDNYISWISSEQLVNDCFSSGKTALIRDHFVRIYQRPATISRCVRDAVIGSRLHISGENEDWYEVRLPDGIKGWIQKSHFGDLPEFSVDNVISMAKEFLGYQYFWGGCTPKGFDCSGFVQTVFNLLGVKLDRDAWQQQEKNVISTNFIDAVPGDLLFFARTPQRVTHVAIALGEGKYIHANGCIKTNSLMEKDQDFKREHFDTFVSVNRYSN